MYLIFGSIEWRVVVVRQLGEVVVDDTVGDPEHVKSRSVLAAAVGVPAPARRAGKGIVVFRHDVRGHEVAVVQVHLVVVTGFTGILQARWAGQDRTEKILGILFFQDIN